MKTNNIKLYKTEDLNNSCEVDVEGYISTLMQNLNKLDKEYIDINSMEFNCLGTDNGWYNGELDLITKKEETKQVKIMLLNNYCNFYEEWKENPNIEVQYYDLEISNDPIKTQSFKFVGSEEEFIKIKKMYSNYLKEAIN